MRVLLAFLPALLFGTYAAFPAAAGLLAFALVPWVLLYTDPRRRTAWGWYVPGAFASWIALHPQLFDFGWYVPLTMGSVLFLLWIPFAPLLRRVHEASGLPRTLTVAVTWTAVEWLRLTFTTAHLDLFSLGYALARFPLVVQVADLAGVYGLTFLLAAANGFLADAWFAWRLRRPFPWRPGLALAATWLAVLGYGAWRLAAWKDVPGPTVAVVQPNIRHTNKNVVGVHLKQVLMTEAGVEPRGADMIVWPENAILDSLHRSGFYLEDLAWLAARKEAPLLVGAMDRPPDRPGKTANAAFLVDAAGNTLGSYRKQLLFPWTEYVPFDEVLDRVAPRLARSHRALTRAAWGFLPTGVPGDGMTLLDLPLPEGPVPFAVLLCSENAYPPIPAEAGRMGARFLVNLTSEGEVGGRMQEQLLRISILRAVESRTPYVRAGNTGISCVIDARGKVRTVLRGRRGAAIDDEGILTAEVPLVADHAPTVYGRSRDAFAVACALGAGVLALRRRRVAAAAALALLSLSVTGCGAPVLGSDPSAAPAALQRAADALASGRPRLALPDLAAACAAPDTCRPALGAAAEAFRATQQFEEGVDFFTEVVARHPALEAEARGYRAVLLEKLSRPVEAEADYAASIRTTPTPRFLALYGNLLLRTDRPEEAIAAFRRARELSPRDAQLVYLIGRAQRLTGDLAASRASLEEALALDPSLDGGWANLGRVLLAQGDTAAAEVALRRALSIQPRNLEARLMLTRIALREGRREDAGRQLAEILKIESAQGGRGMRDDDPR